MPAASAISRTVVARKPFSANSSPASITRWARRSDGGVVAARSGGGPLRRGHPDHYSRSPPTCPIACSASSVGHKVEQVSILEVAWCGPRYCTRSATTRFEIRDDVTAIGPGPGEVRIRVRAAGVCHSDLSARNGFLPQPVPAVLGHEAAGDVIAVGDGVDDLAVGDRVIANWLPACGVLRVLRPGRAVPVRGAGHDGLRPAAVPRRRHARLRHGRRAAPSPRRSWSPAPAR